MLVHQVIELDSAGKPVVVHDTYLRLYRAQEYVENEVHETKENGFGPRSIGILPMWYRNDQGEYELWMITDHTEQSNPQFSAKITNWIVRSIAVRDTE
jgi:hypothetical protein